MISDLSTGSPGRCASTRRISRSRVVRCTSSPSRRNSPRARLKVNGPKLTSFTARIDDPASFMLPDWDRSAGDKAGMPMPPNKRAGELPGPRNKAPRNLVYVMRFVLPQPTKVISVTTYDSEDFVRIEVDKKSVQQGCTLAKHPTYKAEFIRGYPVYADIVTCRLP